MGVGLTAILPVPSRVNVLYIQWSYVEIHRDVYVA